MKRNKLTQKRLRKLLYYNRHTGIFKWRSTRCGFVQSGRIAGSLNSQGYINIMVDGNLYQASRLAWLYMTGQWPKNQIDHINHVRGDNRFCNLRQATNSANGKNRSRHKNNTSGTSGVYWHKRARKYIASITVNWERIFLGSFVKKNDAIKARKAAERLYGFHQNHGKRR